MKVGNKWKRRLVFGFFWQPQRSVFCLTGCTGQTASLTTQQSEVSIAQQTERLMLLCRVWGYVKYRHPAYLLGQRDWDARSSGADPSGAGSLQYQRGERPASHMVHTASGEIDYGRRGAGAFVPFDNQVVESDTSWTKDTAYLGEELAAALALLPEKLPSLDRSAAPVYFDEIGTPNFSMSRNTPPLIMTLPSACWGFSGCGTPSNIITPTCTWPASRGMTACPKPSPPCWMAATRTATNWLSAPWPSSSTTLMSTSAIPDGTYSNTAEIGGYLLPTPIRAVEGKLTVTAAVEGCPLAPGDVLLSINGRTIEELASEKRQYLSLSREELLLEQAKYLITSTDTPEMELVILRDGAELTLTVQGTTHFPQEDLLPYELLEGNIGLINPRCDRRSRHAASGHGCRAGHRRPGC